MWNNLKSESLETYMLTPSYDINIGILWKKSLLNKTMKTWKMLQVGLIMVA